MLALLGKAEDDDSFLSSTPPQDLGMTDLQRYVVLQTRDISTSASFEIAVRHCVNANGLSGNMLDVSLES